MCVCGGGGEGGGGGRGECPLPPVPLLRDTQIFYRHTHTELILLSLGHIQASRDTKQERMTKIQSVELKICAIYNHLMCLQLIFLQPSHTAISPELRRVQHT